MPPLVSSTESGPVAARGFQRITALLSDVVLSLLAVLIIPLLVLAVGVPIAILVRLLLEVVGRL